MNEIQHPPFRIDIAANGKATIYYPDGVVGWAHQDTVAVWESYVSCCKALGIPPKGSEPKSEPQEPKVEESSSRKAKPDEPKEPTKRATRKK